MEPVHRRKYSAEDLAKLIRTLKFSEGFKLDKTQKHESIRSNLIKEAYEVLEAIDMRDSELLKEELGDILLQVMQHSSIEEEKGAVPARKFWRNILILRLKKVQKVMFTACLSEDLICQE